jgi:hypothetical protein
VRRVLDVIGIARQRPVPSPGVPGLRTCGGGAAAAGGVNSAVISDPCGPEVPEVMRRECRIPPATCTTLAKRPPALR